jgi:hypothetical protein
LKQFKEWRERGWRMVGGVHSIMIYLLYCKKFYKGHNIPPPTTTIQKSKNDFVFNPRFLCIVSVQKTSILLSCSQVKFHTLHSS